MWNPKELRPVGETERKPNPFRSEDDTARMVLGCVQLFTFMIAILMLLVVAT
jgi:hypothetical protein